MILFRRNRAASQTGMSLFELMIVLAILALVASIAAPRLTNHLSRAKSQSALLEIKSIAQSIDYFHLDTGRYPSEQEGLAVLHTRPQGAVTWNGPYMEAQQDGFLDPWGAPYRYTFPGENKAFDVFSYGADGKPGGEGENRDIGNWM